MTIQPEQKPWYRQFWPWFIIFLPFSAVVAGIVTLVIALKNPDYLVVDEEQYQGIKQELRAKPADGPASDDPDGQH